MNWNYTAAELGLDWLAGSASEQQVLAHPAYQRVATHARRYGNGITAEDMEAAIEGKDTPFYGLREIKSRLNAIKRLLESIKRNEESWSSKICTAINRFLPGETLDIAIYPIIGYDMGIGLNGGVCLNCNTATYLNDPQEFLYYVIHECVHVLFEKAHPIPNLDEVVTPEQWYAYFNLWCQNEGFAVYAPYYLREKEGHLEDGDYRILTHREKLTEHLGIFKKTVETLKGRALLSRDEYLEHCFGSKRLTYRVGCEIIRRIEREQGLEAVIHAFNLESDHFIENYINLLE